MDIKHRLRVWKVRKVYCKPEKQYEFERAHQSGVLPGIHSIFGSEVRDATGHRDSSASENQDPGAGLDQANLGVGRDF